MRRRAPLCPLAFLMVCAPTVAQEAEPKPTKRFDLRAGYTAGIGTRIDTIQDNKIELLVNIMKRGKPLHIENKTKGYELRYTDEVKGFGPDGKVNKLLRTYTLTKNHETGAIDRTRRVILLDWSTQKGLTFDDEQAAKLSERARELLDSERRRPQGVSDHFIPRRHVAVGERWRVPNLKAAELFLFDPKHVVEEKSKCYGKLVSARPQKNGTTKLKVGLVYKLALTHMETMEFPNLAIIKVVQQLAFTAEGKAPEVTGKTLGELSGLGVHPDYPKGVTAEFTIRVAGTYESKLARRR